MQFLHNGILANAATKTPKTSSASMHHSILFLKLVMRVLIIIRAFDHGTGLCLHWPLPTLDAIGVVFDIILATARPGL
jgi:hypothetical protein